MRDGYGH
jgi:hypothetical protein